MRRHYWPGVRQAFRGPDIWHCRFRKFPIFSEKSATLIAIHLLDRNDAQSNTRQGKQECRPLRDIFCRFGALAQPCSKPGQNCSPPKQLRNRDSCLLPELISRTKSANASLLLSKFFLSDEISIVVREPARARSREKQPPSLIIVSTYGRVGRRINFRADSQARIRVTLDSDYSMWS